jgi:RNA polymerase sigma-70 factor (ECF subfamily)
MNKTARKSVYKVEKKDMPEEIALQKEQLLSPEAVHVEVEKTLSEREILEAVQKGDKEAYGLIVKRYMHAAYYIALGFVHNQQDALDVSQDAFIKAFRKIKKFDTQMPFFPWFYRLMKNLCIDHLKRKRRKSEVPLEDTKVFGEERDDQEIKEVLWRGIRELPFDQREIIILRYFRQMSYAEIAELTGRPIGTVMSSLYYAKKKLKGILGKYLGFE